jgi:hypothetical protein
MKYFLTLLALSFFLAPVGASAAGNLEDALGNLGRVGQTAGTEEGSIENIVGRVIRTALTLVGTIFFVLMIYAGFLWMTARGDEAKVEKAQSIIKAAMIGLVIVVAAYAITVFVTGAFEKL